MCRARARGLVWFATLTVVVFQLSHRAAADVVSAPAGVSLQTYVNQACQRPGGVLLLQGYSYTQDTPLALCSDLAIIGQGRIATVINTTLSSGTLFQFVDASDVTLHGFMIQKTGTAGGTAIWIGYGQHIRLQDLVINGPFSTGIYLTQDVNGSTIWNEFEDIVIENLAANGVGISFAPAVASEKNRINSNRFVDLVIGPNPNSGVTAINVVTAAGVQESNENVFLGGMFYNNETAISVGNSSGRNLVFLGTDIESNRTQGVYIGTGNHGIKFISCWLNQNGASNSASSNLTDNSANNQDLVISEIAGKVSPSAFTVEGYSQLGGIALGQTGAPADGIAGKAGMVLGINGNNEVVLNYNAVNVAQPLVAKRFVSTDTAVVASNFSANWLWGTGATISVAAGSNSQRGQVTVTAGASAGTDPVLTLIFADGRWTTTPVANVLRNDTTSPAVQPTWTTTPTSLVIVLPGTVEPGKSYTFSYKLIG